MIFDFIFNRFVMTPYGIMRLKKWGEMVEGNGKEDNNIL